MACQSHPSDASPTIPSEETTPKPIPNPIPAPARKIPAGIQLDTRRSAHRRRAKDRTRAHRQRQDWLFNMIVLPELLPFPVHCCSGGRLVSLLTHHLDGIRDILLLVGVCVAKDEVQESSCPCFQEPWELCEGLYTWSQDCLSTSFASSSPLRLNDFASSGPLDDLGWMSGSG